MENAFDAVLANMKRLGMVRPDFQGTTMKPQVHPTSQPLQVLVPQPVRTLNAHPRQVERLVSGRPARRQPKPFAPGETVYAKLMPDGLIKLMPFSMAGSGYELVKDAREGEHFAFMD